MTLRTERDLIALARRQRGLLSRDDLATLTGRPHELRRRLRTGAWQQILPGVLGPATLLVDAACLEAAAMLWAPSAGLSHFSAARRSGLWAPDDDDVWVTVPFGDPHRRLPAIRVTRTRRPVPYRSDGFLRWTPPARTVVDLAQCLDERTLSAVLLSAVRKNLATAWQVAAAADRLDGRASLGALRRVIALWTPERESLLEDQLHDDVRAVTTAQVRRQYEVRDRAGRLLGRADVAVPELRIAFEADGLLFHSTDAQIAADQRRDRQFLGAGWQTARFREGAFDDRALVRRDVLAILLERQRAAS